MFYFTYNESKMYESLTFSPYYFFLDVPVQVKYISSGTEPKMVSNAVKVMKWDISMCQLKLTVR